MEKGKSNRVGHIGFGVELYLKRIFIWFFDFVNHFYYSNLTDIHLEVIFFDLGLTSQQTSSSPYLLDNLSVQIHSICYSF